VKVPGRTVEDIRVDTRALKRYPQYSAHYKALLRYCDEKAALVYGTKDKAREALSPQVRVTFELIWRSFSADITDGEKGFTTDPEVEAWFTRNAALVDEIYRVARDPKSTTEDSLVTARKLFQTLYGDPPKDWKNPQQQQKKECQCGCHQTGDFPEDYMKRAKVKGGKKLGDQYAKESGPNFDWNQAKEG
jgi:hypothetical protein